ncbi:MAG: DNA primase [Saprospiraceae bacterium]|nr:DNA primase [Saprospiraceae bacterium]
MILKAASPIPGWSGFFCLDRLVPSKSVKSALHLPLMIPPKQIQEILDATRIEEVVEEFVTLRRRGVNLIGLCPFHGERTPSFNVNPARNIFKCFGCGKAGDAITFLREHENLTYPEALRWLARKYNIEIQEIERSPEQIAEMQLADSLYIVNDFALQHFQQQLFETDEGKSVALAYFRQRGLREETIRVFGLGYAPDERDLLLRRAKAAGYNIELLKKVGLCSNDGGRDFFRARVMFAIHNFSGKVAAFAGRTMSSDKTVPKYVNSPETEIYIKNKTLYGAFQAKKAIRQKDECLLVEGYMDVISLYQAGIENVVASSGTSLTEGQLQLIRRNTQNLKILYDGDPAGIKAALRGLDLALEQDLNVKICLLPDGHDPDSYVQQYGGEEFTRFTTENARDFILFKTDLLLEETKGDPIRRAGLVKDIINSIARIPDPIKRSVYLKQCSALLEVQEQVLHNEANKLITQTIKKKEEKAARQPGAASDIPPAAPQSSDEFFPSDMGAYFPPSEAGELPPDWNEPAPTRPPERKTDAAYQERDIVRLLIQYGGKILPEENMTVGEYILGDIEELLGEFDNPLYGKVAAECHAMLLEGKTFDLHYFIQHASPEINNLAIDLLAEPWEFSPNWEAMWNYPLQNQPMPERNFSLDTRQALDRFKLQKVQKIIALNLARIQSASKNGDDEAMMRYMKIQQKLFETRNEIARRLGTVVLV